MSIRRKLGFTSMEILLSTVTVSALSIGAGPQFMKLTTEARVAAVHGVLGATRTALQLQRMQLIMRCGGTLQTRINIDQLNQNDITAGEGAPCVASALPSEPEHRFLTEPLAANPFTQNNRVINCDGASAHPCAGIDPADPTSAGWCYDSRADKFWAHSNQAGECEL